MTPAEIRETEAMLNGALQALVVTVVLLWWGWWGWRRLGLPGLDWRRYVTLRPPETVDSRPAASSTERAPAPADEQTDGQTDRTAHDDPTLTALRLDRSRKAVVRALVEAGWSVGEIRTTLRGDNGAIGDEVRQAREALDARAAGEAPARTLVVRDGQGERIIAL